MSAVLSSLPTGRISRTPRHVVTIAGQPVHAYAVETQHGVKRPKGTATIRLPHPGYTETQLHERWLNQPIEAQIGYDEDGGARRVFTGRISGIKRAFSTQGFTLEVTATGWAALLDFPSEADIVFPPLSRLYDIIRSLCAMRGLPMYSGELITYPNSTAEVRLGGVPEVDEGQVIIPKRTSPLQWLVNTLSLFGYACCDRPDGSFWWGRVMGVPPHNPVATFAQGVNVFQMSRDDSLDQMVTWWDVEGASYTDNDGIPVKVRSFPATVPYSPYLDPPGYARQGSNSGVLVTSALADAHRNVMELNTAAPYEAETWRTPGSPAIQPGEVVALTSDLLELDAGPRWVMSVDHTSSVNGIRTTWSGWQGAGYALEPGDDREEIPIFTGYRHVGNEYLDWYGQKAPQGREITFDITIPDTFTAMYLEIWLRGSNSFLLGGPTIDATVSKIEVWQGGEDKPKGSANLPSVPEDVREVQFHRLPLPGRPEPGVATVKLISGEDGSGGPDDWEGYNGTLVLTGRGYPALPSGGS